MDGPAFTMALRELGLSKEEFAREIGASRRTVYYWSRDGAPPAVAMLVRHVLSSKVPPPLAGPGADLAAAENVVFPQLDALRQRIVGSGWSGDLVDRAVASWLERRERRSGEGA